MLCAVIHIALFSEVYNVNGFYEANGEAVDVNINMAEVMGVFLAQLRYHLAS